MATISPRLDDQGARNGWQARVRKKGYPQQTKTFRTKAAAEAWARSVESAMERDIWRDTSEAENTTLDEALERYVREVSVRKRGHQQELSKIRQWQNRTIAQCSLARIRSLDISEAMREMEQEGKNSSTIRKHLAIISHLYTVAKSQWGMQHIDYPGRNLQKPPLPRGRQRRFENDEAARLFAACKAARNPWLFPVVYFALETAMRIGEIVETRGKSEDGGRSRPINTKGLLWDNVDLKGPVAFLPQTKNGEPRTVPLSPIAVRILKELRCSRDPRVFPTTYEAIHLAFHRACRRANIVDFRFHDLRHEATSRLFENYGFNPIEVSVITGHKTLEMLNRYTHLRPEDLAKRMR